jgi:hypothetical protein
MIATDEPALTSVAQNGLPSIGPGSAIADMETVDHFPTGSLSLFFVAKQLKSTAPLDDTDGTFIFSTSNSLFVRRKEASDYIVADPAGDELVSFPENTFQIVTVTFNSTIQEYSLSVNNGIPVTTIFSGGTETGPLQMFNIGSFYGNKEICELFITTDLLSEVDMNLAKDYLNTKYNVY